ncbi:MAG: YihY family inner membrane protein [bacterium]|nr:YihY family inner membrane protein [bacterium]
MRGLLEFARGCRRFFEEGLWKLDPGDYSAPRAFLIAHLQSALLAAREFQRDKCHLHASALTFYSLMSIVPVAALAFGIAKGFDFEKALEKRLLTSFPQQQEVLRQVFVYAGALLNQTKGGFIAGAGVILLFWSATRILGRIEESFNGIWRIARGRHLKQKILEYIAILAIAPILIIASSGITIAISGFIDTLIRKIPFLQLAGPAVFFFLGFSPLVMVWALFTLAYIFIPNTRVRIGPAIYGGVIAGTLYQIVQWAYIEFQVGLTRYGAIYGSFAALPLFFIWLQTSWLIVLIGTELAFIRQNYADEKSRLSGGTPSGRDEKTLALAIVRICVQRFTNGALPASATEIAQELPAPPALTEDLLKRLAESGVLSLVADNTAEDAPRYQPARDTDQITLAFVLAALEGGDGAGHSEKIDAARAALSKLEAEAGASLANRRLRDL